MTTISRDDVQHLAQLSNLQLGDDEAAGLQQDIGTILNYKQPIVSVLLAIATTP